MKYALIILVVLLIVCGLPYRLGITRYHLSSARVKGELRICVMSDLHNDYYGKDMEKILKPIEDFSPDLILIPGDMVGDYARQNAYKLLKALGKYTTFYVTGNHEEYQKDPEGIISTVRSFGIHVPESTSEVLNIRGTEVEVGGIRCPHEVDKPTAEEVKKIFRTDAYRILLSHRPHWADLYGECGNDLTVTGHAHGGQWRIPFTGQGIAAPNQGFFPKYTDGIIHLAHGELLISRGLVRHYHRIPRLYNDPELIFLTVDKK